jgi:hypothetical protein
MLEQAHSLTESMPTYLYQPELMRVEAEWLRLVGREAEARRLLLRAISTAQEHGSCALAVRSALALTALTRSPAAERDADLTLLSDLCERLPPENDTNYRREASAVVGGAVATTPP